MHVKQFLRFLLFALIASSYTSPVTAGFFDGNIAYESGNYEEAFRQWRDAASKGDANSMNSLGKLYEEGKGTKRDSVLAYVYYDLANILGNPDAGKNISALKARMNSADLTEATRLSDGVKETGQLPPETRGGAASTSSQTASTTSSADTSTQTTQSTQTTTQASQSAETTQSTTSEQPQTESAETTTTVASNAPQIEFRQACNMRLTWQDKGSNGTQDVALYDAQVPDGFYVIGGYAQGNYNAPNGCVTVVRTNNPGLLAKPVSLKRVWMDKGSGANMDGSLWAPTAPSNDYVCLGHVGQTGYNTPNAKNYRCVHRCLVTTSKPTNPVWTDDRTGARDPVSIYQLPGARSFFAIPNRKQPDLLEDLNPYAACITGG